jgi:hypothetical protein
MQALQHNAVDAYLSVMSARSAESLGLELVLFLRLFPPGDAPEGLVGAERIVLRPLRRARR